MNPNDNDEMYYLNGPDEFMNPNESTSAPVEKEENPIEAIKNLSYKCLQWENGEIKGYDESKMEGGLTRIFNKINQLQEENARLRSLIEKAFVKGCLAETNFKERAWEQFKKENNL
jgi:hypothetical protein